MATKTTASNTETTLKSIVSINDSWTLSRRHLNAEPKNFHLDVEEEEEGEDVFDDGDEVSFFSFLKNIHLFFPIIIFFFYLKTKNFLSSQTVWVLTPYGCCEGTEPKIKRVVILSCREREREVFSWMTRIVILVIYRPKNKIRKKKINALSLELWGPCSSNILLNSWKGLGAIWGLWWMSEGVFGNLREECGSGAEWSTISALIILEQICTANKEVLLRGSGAFTWS